MLINTLMLTNDTLFVKHYQFLIQIDVFGTQNDDRLRHSNYLFSYMKI